MEPSLLTTSRRRDSLAFDNSQVESEAATTLLQDDTIEHAFESLSQVYSKPHVDLYDLIGLGNRAIAQRLAEKIPTKFSVSSYLDLGAGTRSTTIACAKRLVQGKEAFEIVLLDGLKDMLNQALKKFREEIPNHVSLGHVSAVFGDVCNFPSTIISNDGGSAAFSLITAQRVFLNIKKDRRVEFSSIGKGSSTQKGS